MNYKKRVVALFAVVVIVGMVAFVAACSDPFGKYSNPLDPQNSHGTPATIATYSSTSTTIPGTTASTSTTTSTLPGTTTTATIGAFNGTYRIDSVSSSDTEQTDAGVGAQVYNATYAGMSSQKWMITPSGAYYQIVNLANGYAVGGSGTVVATQVITGSDTILWQIVSLGAGKYKVINKAYSTALHISGNALGNPVVLATYIDGDTSFQWTISNP